MARDDLHFRLRIPEDLKELVEDSASLNRRSMTSEINDRLYKSFANWPSLEVPRQLYDRAMNAPANVLNEIEDEISRTVIGILERKLPRPGVTAQDVAIDFEILLLDEPPEIQEKLMSEFLELLQKTTKARKHDQK